MKLPRDAKPEDIERYDRPSTTLKFLGMACENRTVFTVFGEDNRACGKTRLLTINREPPTLLFDAIMDEGAEERILAHPNITMFSEVDGLRMWFETGKLKAQVENNETYYLANLPGAVYRHQRRQFFRAPVPKTLEGRIALTTEQGVELSGAITDMSQGGLCLLFPGDLAHSFSTGQSFVSVITITGELNMNTDVEVRLVRYLADQNATRVGVRFINLSTANERILTRLVFKLQAMQREVEGN